MNYLTLVLDKSALQGLSPREARWLFHHFRVNCPPVFFSEILADLTKKKPRTASAEGDVMALAKKITDYSVHTNSGADALMVGELHGRRPPLTGQIIDSEAEHIPLDNGKRAIYIDSTPTQDMLQRWVKGDFSESDRDFAREWREGISQIKLEEMFRKVKALRRADIRTAEDVDRVVHEMLVGRDFHLLQTMYRLTGVSPKVMEQALIAWRKMGKPPASQFFPYAFFIVRIELYFWIGLANQIVTTRDTNRIDIEYLKYLPFTQVFSSADDLHIQAAKHFLMEHNAFISGADLKKGLAEIADRWEAIDENTRELGTATYADYPPTDLDNGITKLYDRYISGWREGANLPKPRITQEENDRIMKEIRPMMEAIERKRKKNADDV